MSTSMDRVLGPIKRRLALMVGRAMVRLVNDGTQLQALQLELLQGEIRADVERVQNYGFTSVPHAGAEAVAVAVSGLRDHVLVVAVDDRRYRLKGLADGEVAIYTDEGDLVHIKRGGTIRVVAATKVRIESPLVEMTGDLHVMGNVQVDGDEQVDGNVGVGGDVAVSGQVVADGDVTGQGTSLHTHKHGGVTAGPGQTGVPV